MLLRDFPDTATASDSASVHPRTLVLVVDDSEPQRYAIGRTLQAAGYDVLAADSGEAALTLATSHPIEAVVLDVHLPGIDGFAVCRALKKQMPILPVLLLSSAVISAARMHEGLEAGADAYLEHPLSPQHLCAMIGALVRIRRTAVETTAQLRANSLLQDALDALVDHVALIDHAGEIVAVNRAWIEFARRNGYRDRSAGLGRNYLAVCNDDVETNGREIGRGVRDVLAGRREAFEAIYPCHAPDEERWFSINVRAMHRAGIDRVAAIVLHTDRTAEVLRNAAELRFKAFVEASRQVIWGLDAQGRTTYVNPRVTTLCGYEPSELMGKPLADYLVPCDSSMDARYANVPADHFEAILRARSGADIDVVVALSPITGSRDGTSLIAVVADNSQRKAAERDLVGVLEALKLTEQRLRDQFAKLPVATFLYERCDGDFYLIDANDAGTAMLGRDGRKQIGRSASELFPAAWQIQSELERCVLENAVVRHRNLRYATRAHADERTFDLTAGPQPPDRVLLHLVETTEQTRLTNELRQAQKMEAIGRLAGGIAHDFNNLLTVIGAHCTFLTDRLRPGDERHADAIAIQDAANRAASLTRQLLAFSRKQLLAPADVDLNTIVEGSHRLLRRVLGEDIVVDLELAPTPQYVHADSGQLEQVLLNLAVNARDAMPNGGRLTISSASIDAAANESLPPFVPPASYVRLSIKDTGIGMSEEIQARIFEPFFTTKEPGHGTGLGLSTVYGIIRQSDGYIAVTSSPNAGTTFDIYLPACTRPSAALTPRSAPSASARSSGATILLVEDDVSVRHIAVRVLRRAGHQVIEAMNGPAALAAARRVAALDLVIADAVMPGMSGGEVIRLVREIHPAANALLVSGYTDDEMTRRGIRLADVAFLSKPFTPPSLARRVEELLQPNIGGRHA